MFNINYGNVFSFGGKNAANVVIRTSTLRPEELWGIDAKLDDSRPACGSVMAVGIGDLPF